MPTKITKTKTKTKTEMEQLIPIKAQPRLLEAVIQEMQVQLAAGLPWLRSVFGKAERTQVKDQGRKFYTPSVYVGNGKYERIVPDARAWGNYAFFYLDGEERVGRSSRVRPYFDVEGEINLIVWFDLRDIEAEDDRNTESVKWMVMQVLGGMRLTAGRVELERVYEEDKEVWEHYSQREETGETNMWPYQAFRFRFKAECNSGCE